MFEGDNEPSISGQFIVQAHISGRLGFTSQGARHKAGYDRRPDRIRTSLPEDH